MWLIADIREFGAQETSDDNTQAIQDAIYELKRRLLDLPEDACGGLYFPRGIWVIRQQYDGQSEIIDLASRIVYFGEGPGVSVIKLGDDHPFNVGPRMMGTRDGIGDAPFIFPNTPRPLGWQAVKYPPWRNMVFDGLTFDGNVRGNRGPNWLSEDAHALFLAGVRCITVKNCEFNDVRGDGINIHTGALNPEPSSHVDVLGCRFRQFLRSGVHYKHARDSVIRNNIFEDAPFGVAFNIEVSSSTVPIGNLWFVDNEVNRCGVGVKIQASTAGQPSGRGFYIMDNFFDMDDPLDVRSSAVAIEFFEAQDVIIAHNWIQRARGHAILIRSCQRVRIAFNYVADTLRPRDWIEPASLNLPGDLPMPPRPPPGAWEGQPPTGIVYCFATGSSGILPRNEDIEIVGNVVRDNDGHGIWLERVIGFFVENNVVARNSLFGLNLGGGAGDLVPAMRGTIRCNTFSENRRGISIVRGSGLNVFRSNRIIDNVEEGILIDKSAATTNDFGREHDPGGNCISGNGYIPTQDRFVGMYVGLEHTPSPQQPILPVYAQWNWWGCPSGSGITPPCNSVDVENAAQGVIVVTQPVDPSCDHSRFLYGECSIAAAFSLGSAIFREPVFASQAQATFSEGASGVSPLFGWGTTG